jgi:hypothetical protein
MICFSRLQLFVRPDLQTLAYSSASAIMKSIRQFWLTPSIAVTSGFRWMPSAHSPPTAGRLDISFILGVQVQASPDVEDLSVRLSDNGSDDSF